LKTDVDDIYACLSRVDPFSRIDTRALKEISRQVEIAHFPANRFVFRQGDPSLECLLIIVAGMVELLVTSDNGTESVVGYRKAGDFFSETVVLSGQNYTGSARSTEPLDCIRVDRALLEDLIHTHPEFSKFFSTLLAERMRLLYESIRTEKSEVFTRTCELPLFAKKVGEIMSRPVNTCNINDQVSDVSQKMAAAGTGSAVVLDAKDRPIGILTEKNIVHHLVARGSYPVENCRAGQIMTTDFDTLPPEAFMGQALATLTRQQVKYLLVIQDGKLAGILTAMDLIKSRNIGNLILLEDIRSHSTIQSLAKISHEVDGVLNALLMEGAATRDILEIMSGLLDRLTRAVIRIAEKEMEAHGLGPPPMEYCWINMGSAARHEQTLRTDQDNGIIYADPDDPAPETQKKIQAYFQTLGGIIVDGLNECGFALCKGNVMASNPQWCRSVSQWKKNITRWGGSFDPEDTRKLTICLDFRPLWGNHALADILWETIFGVLEKAEVTNHMLTHDDLQREKPIGLLGKIRTEKSGPHKDAFNLKTNGLVHLVNGMRIYAVNHRIKEASTLGRLERLTEKQVFSEDTAELLKTGFETLMMFKIRINAEKLNSGEVPDNYIRPAELTRKQRELIKDSLLAVMQMQKTIHGDFNSAWLNFFS
jgi:CBS domain-containing protein